MEEHGTSHLGNCMDVLLSDAILMVSRNTAEVNFLFQGGDVIFKGLGCKYPIISSLTLKVPPPVSLAHRLNAFFILSVFPARRDSWCLAKITDYHDPQRECLPHT
jgi:hypothetical protein